MGYVYEIDFHTCPKNVEIFAISQSLSVQSVRVVTVQGLKDPVHRLVRCPEFL